MAGYTGVTASRVNSDYVYLPCEIVQSMPLKRVNMTGITYGRLRFSTKQPPFEPDGFLYDIKGKHDDLHSLSVPAVLDEFLHEGATVQRMNCVHLSKYSAGANCENPLKKLFMRNGFKPAFMPSNRWATQAFCQTSMSDIASKKYLQLLASGPHDFVHFDTDDTSAAAAIVTCGGLCPGLNNVIRELVLQLHAYGVKTVYGIIGGYKGCVEPEKWIELTPTVVQDIHMQGGSILVSDRGNPPHSAIAESLKKKNIRQYFAIGGDGTNKGAFQTFEAMTAIGYECSVVGIPKTIDNDIMLVDQTFGFDTACTEAEKAIDSAWVEATTNANCIGLVKLMGRHCGWIAAVATLAARHVDLCLIPEMKMELPKVLDYVAQIMKRKKYAVVVVAEGCGDTIIASDSGAVDGGGNKVLADVGPYLKDALTAHCKKEGIPITIKYIDPTYMIRSVPANAFDSMYCSVLAQEAVHSAMAGFTGMTIGKVDERYVLLPIHSIVDKGSRVIDSATMGSLLSTTGQPRFDEDCGSERPDSPTRSRMPSM
jgi:6-phosphofructokinase 1